MSYTPISFRFALAGLGAAALLSAGAVALAQAKTPQQPATDTQATTQPQREQENRDGRRQGQDRPDRPEGDRGGPGGPDSPGRGGPPRGMWMEPTTEQWEEALGFLRENSPRRLELYDRALADWRQQQQGPVMQDDLPRSIRGARARIFGRVQMLRMIERGDPQLYTISLDQFRLEDQIIGALHDAHQARTSGNEAAATEAVAKSQEAVRRYALGTIREREERIKRMREELTREEQRLEEDRNQMDRLIDRLLERFQRSVPGGQGPREGQSEGQRGENRDDGSSKAGG